MDRGNIQRAYGVLRLAGCLSLLVFAGCSTSTTLFSAIPELPKGQSCIVVYRPKRMRANDVHPHVYLDGVKQFPLRNAGYNVLNVVPGKHTVEAKGSTLAWGMPPRSLTINLGSDEMEFLRLYVEPGVFRDNVIFEVSDEKSSLAALRSLRLSH